MDAVDYTLIILGRKSEVEATFDVLVAELQYYGVPAEKAGVVIHECTKKGFIVVAGGVCKLTRLGTGMYKVAEFNLPAWPYNDIRKGN
jgi:hypothetical protein